jgi:spermidine synthase
VLRTERLGEATTPDGTVLALFRHGRDYYIRVGTVELMSTRRINSEQRLAELCCEPFRDTPGATVLIGGLGFGFTLKTTLQTLGPDAKVVVAELVQGVIDWNLNPEYDLCGEALADPRVDLRLADVTDVMRESPGVFHAIMLDVDNGAESLTDAGNADLYRSKGVREAAASLRPGGLLAYWSADDDARFAEVMRKAGLAVEVHRSRAHTTSGVKHTVIVGRKAP